MTSFLHEHSDFKELLEITAQNKKINDPYLVEKDYWIMHCLWGLRELEFLYHLKGGTSLSKGYQCIHRFSEDIDIRIESDERCGFEVYSGKNHDKPKQIESRKNYFDWIQTMLLGKIDGLTEVVRDTTFDDADFRSGGIRLYYQSHFQTATGLKDGVLLEVGFDKTAPNRPIDISSWALDAAVLNGAKVLDNNARAVLCYEPRFTFVEKLQAVVKKFRQYKSGSDATSSLPANFIRHYYDLYQLIDRKDVQSFIGTPEYEAFKKERFKNDNTKVSASDALRLSNTNDRKIFEKEYDRSSGLYFQGRPTLEQMLARFARDLDRL
jgi:predicted nucleotidyltransferase component of viral defense system